MAGTPSSRETILKSGYVELAVFVGRWEDKLTRNFGLGSSSGHFGICCGSLDE
jgi:hypothetical protein